MVTASMLRDAVFVLHLTQKISTVWEGVVLIHNSYKIFPSSDTRTALNILAGIPYRFRYSLFNKVALLPAGTSAYSLRSTTPYSSA